MVNVVCLAITFVLVDEEALCLEHHAMSEHIVGFSMVTLASEAVFHVH